MGRFRHVGAQTRRHVGALARTRRHVGARTRRHVGARTRRHVGRAVVTALGVGAVLTVGSGSSGAAGGGEVQLQFAAISVQSIRLNVGPKEASTGDRLVFSHTLTKGGKTAGLSGVECVLTSVTTSAPKGKQKPVTSARSHCIATVVLTDGQIAAQGLTDLTDPAGAFDLAVTGGTGRYAGAAGDLRKTGGKDKGSYLIDITTG